MTKAFIQTLAISAFLILASNVKAQSDYIISQKGDSISCTISTPFLSKIDRYKTDANSKTTKINPDEVKRYYRADRNKLYYSVYKTGKDKPEFMPVIEHGKINLFEVVETSYSSGGMMHMTTTSSTTYWYVSKGADTVKELKTSGLFWLGKSKQNRKDILGDMVKDNKTIYDQYVAEDKFSFKQIRKLVHLYNTGEPLKED